MGRLIPGKRAGGICEKEEGEGGRSVCEGEGMSYQLVYTSACVVLNTTVVENEETQFLPSFQYLQFFSCSRREPSSTNDHKFKEPNIHS